MNSLLNHKIINIKTTNCNIDILVIVDIIVIIVVIGRRDQLHTEVAVVYDF